MTQNDFETAECFADAFSSVFVQEPLGPLPKCCYTNNTDFESEIGSEIIITEEDVFNELKSLNIYKSFGPDQVHPKLLHALADNNSFVRCIMHLFSKCINEQRIPNIWEKANVVALHKKDSKLDPLNYRPVSLTCILCKLDEKFLSRHILKFVNEKIVNDKHGFMEGKSCFSNLLEAVDSVLEMLEAGVGILWIFFTLIFGKFLTQFHITGYSLSWRNTESRAQF